MCEHCGARDFVRRANKVSDALIEAGRHQDAAVAFRTGDGIRITGHVPRKALEYLWDIEVELNIDEPRPEVWGTKENPMPKAKKLSGRKLSLSLKRQTEGRACKGCIHEDIPIEEQPCCGCTEADPKYDVGEQEPKSRSCDACKGCIHDAKPFTDQPCSECTDKDPKYDVGPQETEPGAVPGTVTIGFPGQTVTMTQEQFTHACKTIAHDPVTGEVPTTDRDLAVSSIAGLVQRVVDENAPRALAAYLETREQASFAVTCKLSSDPVRSASVFIEVSGKLAVGVKGASGFVSIDDQQTRIAGT